MLEEYLWCVVVGGLFCFTLGFGMGANDVSNNFGTSVGSKSITLKKAILIAGVFELLGSVLLGASVTDSVRKGVFEPDVFGAMPDLLLMANMCALIAGTLWLLFASTYGLPVSATHALIGALAGCGLAMSGTAINWRYIGIIISTWIVSPLLSSIVSIFYYSLLRKFILRSERSVTLGIRWLWLLLFIICAACSVFFMFSNPLSFDGFACDQKITDPDTGIETIQKVSPCKLSRWVTVKPGTAFGIGIGLGAALTLILAPFVYWRALKQLKKYDQTQAALKNNIDVHHDNNTSSITLNNQAESVLADLEIGYNKETSNPPQSSTQASLGLKNDDEEAKPGCKGHYSKVKAGMPWNQDLHAEAFAEDEKAADIAKRAEHFDQRCETFFMTVQIVSASLSCLVHGSNDVANAAAPYATVYSIYQHGAFMKSVQVPVWILFLGGGAIAVGLCFLGHAVIKKIGIELVYISPSRGFCIELSAATVMIIGSFIGLPLSTTHVTVGSMIGVGLLDRRIDPETGEDSKTDKKILGLNFSAINWSIMKRIAIAWVGTLLVSGVIAFCLFSFAVNSPTKIVTRYAPCSDSMHWGDDELCI